MIPVHLTISGFLSYQDSVDIDFTSLDLACIAGANGSGKSSLLDAMTWVLFGQARKRDDSLINNQSDAAEVSMVFEYEGNIYRVQRSKPREKTTLLEFNILQVDESMSKEEIRKAITQNPTSVAWKPLSERTLRETEARIVSTLRLDYETFVNASFFLQGKADQFTQQRPGDRKRILGSILGLEIWESYRQQTGEQRRDVEVSISRLEGHLGEITTELNEEDERKERLKQLEHDLKRLTKERETQEVTLASVRQVVATLLEQEKLVDTLLQQLETSQRQLQELNDRAVERRSEQEEYTQIIAHAKQIESSYQAWQDARRELEGWEQVAKRFREHDSRRERPRSEIAAARARLEQELETLQKQKLEVESAAPEIDLLQKQVESVQTEIKFAEAELSRRYSLESDLKGALQTESDTKSENDHLKSEMEKMKDRIEKLTIAEGASCPLCGQPLQPQDRQALIETLSTEGTEMGDRFRSNKELLSQASEKVSLLENQITSLSQVDVELRKHAQTMADLTSQQKHLEDQRASWVNTVAPRQAEIEKMLETEQYAKEARTQLAEIDAELKAIGYDAAEHDSVQRAELEGRKSEQEIRMLEKALAALTPLEREISDLDQQITILENELKDHKKNYTDSFENLTDAQARAPDMISAERNLMDIQEQENRLRLEVGAASQKVEVLGDLKSRRKELELQRENQAHLVGQYKQLERAFGKDGVPALLIEQAIPQIQTKTNEILARLSDGNMSVQFITQAQYKDKKREDLRETLEIQVSDNSGKRDYEMYSGGEAFRINFAIRLALSEILAQRAGARLQTLVIDEGFGSQDALGRQRLIEAINMVKPDFAKILVITHIEELKDTFPIRIEVEKTDRGSVVTMN